MSEALEIEEPAIEFEEPIEYNDKRILSLQLTEDARLDVQLSNGDNAVYEIFYEENEERIFLNNEYPLFEILSKNPFDINEGVLFISDYNSEILEWSEIDVVALFKGKESIQGFYYNADDTDPDIDNSLAEYGIIDADKLPTKTIEIEVQISDEEKLEIARKQNELLEKIVKTEMAAKRVAREYKTTIDALELELNELHSEWQTPFNVEYHTVKYYKDLDKSVIHYFELNTNKLVKSEPLIVPPPDPNGLFGTIEDEETESEFPDIDTSEESTNEFLNEINSENESVSDEEE